MRFWLVALSVFAVLGMRIFFGVLGDVCAMGVLLVAVMVYGFSTLKALARGQWGVDIIALLAMGGALLMHEWWAGLVVFVMLTGGEWLEVYAFKRAHAELATLLERAPTIAHVKVGSELRDVPVEKLVLGQTLVVKPGEMIPADGIVVAGSSSVDASRLTGESLPADVGVHDRVLAGSFNQGGLLEVRVLTLARESQYNRIRSLVADAEKNKAPLVRLADRWSGWFTLATLLMAGLAWVVSHDPVRVLAVLVVATPCPLILATPVAFLSGMSRAFSRGIIVKHGGALEVLARVRAMVFDKTGTLTFGMPRIRRVASEYLEAREVIRLAASLDQGSAHVLAHAITEYAREKRISFTFPTQFVEHIGQGVLGNVDGVAYAFGRLTFLEGQGVRISAQVRALHERDQRRGERSVYLGRGKQLAGIITFADVMRPGLRALCQRLKTHGVEHLTLLTGDREGPAQVVAKSIGIRDVRAECLPEDKLTVIRELQKTLAPVAMMGDGVNDAPALASADVGIAMMGGLREGVSSEASDIVIVADDVARVEEAVRIAKRTVVVAKTGIFVGMGLSGFLMVLALLGIIPPFTGAWLQELIDVTVIVQALRARRP